MRSMYWLCRSWGRRGTAAYLTDRVKGTVRMYTESGEDVELGDARVADLLRRALRADHGVEAPLLDRDALEPRLGHAQPRGLGEEQQHHAHDHHRRGRARRDEPRILDRRDEAAEVGEGELEPAPRCPPLLLPWEEIDFDHAARLSASPTDSISSGATSSTDTDSNTASRTLSRCTGLATSTGTLSRLPSASFSPGMRAPPPIVYTRPRPPAEREAVARNAAARSTPTAISSPRASTYGARSPLCVRP